MTSLHGFPPALLILLMALTLFAQPDRVTAQADRPEPQSLTAVGNAEIRVTPDLAQVQVGVVTEAPTASDSRQQNAARAAKVVAAVMALGIKSDSIHTSVFQVEPMRQYEQNQKGEPPITGYRVTNSVSVRTSKLDLVPKIIDDAIGAGANRVDGVNFMLSDEAGARRTALAQAVVDARANADVMAKGLGATVMKVRHIQQGGALVQPPGPMFRGDAMMAGPPTPILAGEITVNASVTVTYEIRE